MVSVAKFDQWQNTAGVNYNNVVQVVNSSYSTQIILSTAATGTWWETGLTAAITPKFATSKILVLVTQSYHHDSSGPQGTGYRIYRNGVAITGEGAYSASYTNANRVHGFTTINYIDSPATTSVTTYKIYGTINNTGGNVYWQYNNTECPSRITLMEIAQ